MKKLFSLFLILFVAGGVLAQTYVGDFAYQFEDGYAFICKCSKSSGSITIPSTVTYSGEKYTVVWISSEAFSYRTGLTSITIPESVTGIGSEAFLGCTGLTSITIPNSVTTIGYDAFYGCTGLTSITIPEGMTEIGGGAFYNCTGLTSITIPESVTTIGYDAFYGCTGLTSVTLAEGLTSIGIEAFYGCTGLTSIAIPESVTTIGYDAFKGIKYVFYWGTASGAPWGAEGKYRDDGDYLYSDANKTTLSLYIGTSGDVVISESVKTIESSAFDGCTIEKVTFNAQNCNKTTIFNNMGSIKEVSFGNTVTTIPQGLFSGCSAIGSVTIPNSVVTVEASAFENCTKLKELTIGANCNSIGENAFGGCSRLVDVRCMAEDVPLASQSSFANYNGYLYVPCEYVRWYKADNIFGQFANTECIPSNDSELQSDDVAVVPEINNALFTMPRNNDANSYTLTIQNNGVTFCTLTFNENGQLSNIDFSTNKSYELKAGVSAFQFTVTGLSTAADYGYSFKALASNKSVLKEYTGSFTTKNADGTGGSSSSDNGGQGGGSGEGGQGGQGGSTAINGVSNATTVAIVNNQILVNGEAPAFVVTVSGKKIANQNLKSGVYFVNVEGETVKVVK